MTIKTIRCGHCHQQHATIDEVRLCADLAHSGLPAATVQPSAAGATEKQIAFVTKLLAEREHGFDESTVQLQLNVTTQSRKDTSKLIDHLISCPPKPKVNTAVALEDGIYTYEGKHYRVYHTVHSANQQVASLINTEAPKEAKKRDKFTYLGKKPLAFLRPEHRMSFEEAKAFGSAYEWCCACGAILHNDKSVELGIGPICRGKFS